MALDDATLLRAAGVSLVVAIAALIVAGITIALFFGGAGAYWGPINDVAVAITLLALVPPVLAVERVARPGVGPWLDVVTVAALAGIVLGAAGQLLLVAGVIDLQASFVTGGLGILPVVAWLIALAVLALGPGVLPAQVGWLALAVLVLAVALSVLAGIASGPPVWAVSVALLAVLVGWMGTLAATLLQRGAVAA